MSETTRRTPNVLNKVRNADLVNELRSPETQKLITDRKFNRSGYAKYLTAKLGFTVTPGNIYQIARQLNLVFVHHCEGVRPPNRMTPGDNYLVQQLAEAKLAIAQLTELHAALVDRVAYLENEWNGTTPVVSG